MTPACKEFSMPRIFSAVLAIAICTGAFAHAETIQLPAVKDNSIVLVDGEWNENAGAQARIRAKGNQHIIAMAFDTSAIKGKRVVNATLVCVQGEKQIAGVTLSTIATPWEESRSTGLSSGETGVVDWGYAGAMFPAVSGGNSHTLVSQAESVIRDGSYFWDVPPDMVHAMAIGVAHGLAIHEHDADYGRNPTIFAREQSGKKPYLLVELGEQIDAPPQPPSDLQLNKSLSGAARLSFKAPAQGFAYIVNVNDVPLGRHNIPLVAANEPQSVWLRDLEQVVKPDQVCRIHVVTLDRHGNRSEPSVIEGVIREQATVPKTDVPFASAVATPVDGIGIMPISDKYDQSGKAVGTLPGNYRTQNAIYNGEKVRLIAAAGEVVGFQMLVRGRGEVNLDFKFDGTPMRTDLFSGVYVPADGRMIADPLVPLSPRLALNADKDEVIVADIYVPFDSRPGVRKGKITISDGREIAVELRVLPFALPRKATFLCEMNSYGLPDTVEEYYALQQIAYDHRVHANILHYSHNTAAPGSRKSNLDMRLTSGRRMDNKRYDNISPGATTAYWDDFAEAFGPFIDGSCFRDGHRGPIAAPGFYLTFHESWPLNCRAFFNGNQDAYKAFDDPSYEKTYINVLQSFASLAKTRGWNETGFHVYFNNKGSLNELTKSPWILDEPSSYWDYRALRFYGDLTDKGRAAEPEIPIHYRVDISRPEFCRGQFGRRDDLWVVSSWAFKHYRRLVTDRIEEDELKAWVYGTSNHVHETNRNIQAWALDAWKDGATGIVPWQTVDKSGKAMTEADQLGLFIFDKDDAGKQVIRHSLRLKAFREAQQLIEYLHLLKQKRGWTQEQMQQFIAHYVPLDAAVNKVNEEDAGTTSYDRTTPDGIEMLRRAAVVQMMQ
jgi:hypothetical protein